jgi:hypothetical protein
MISMPSEVLYVLEGNALCEQVRYRRNAESVRRES